VHQAQEADLEVRWRNVRIQELPLAPTGLAPNTLTQAERKRAWRFGRAALGSRGLG